MNITFLIGNGFDLNLGLDTLYLDFVEKYKNKPTRDEDIKIFRKHIQENKELWSSAEEEFGQYSRELEKGEAAKLAKCQKDFCEHLAEYLKAEESRVHFDAEEKKVLAAFSNLEHIVRPFSTQEKSVLDGIYKARTGQNITFNFINFNYTSTLDKCIEIVSRNPDVLKSHKSGSTVYKHRISENIIHVHGTVEENMVFAVNDETQIANIEVFECNNGNIYKNLVIKKKANDSYGENTDVKAWNLIKESQIVYVYGMSIGDTDKLWWNRICVWLSDSADRHLIVHNYKMPQKGVFPVDYQIAEQDYKVYITSKSTLSQEKQDKIQKQIHITNHNLFSNIAKIADAKPIVIDIFNDKFVTLS